MARYERLPTEASHSPPSNSLLEQEHTVADIMYPPILSQMMDTLDSSDISDDDADEKQALSRQHSSSSFEEDLWPRRRRSLGQRKLFLPLLVIALSLGSFILILALSNSHLIASNPNLFVQNLKTVELDHIFNGTFHVNSRDIHWLKEGDDGTFAYRDKDLNVVLEHIETGEKKVLVKFHDVTDERGQQLYFSSYKVSPDLKYILFATDTQKQWRHSSHSNFYIHEIATSTSRSLRPKSNPPQTSIGVWAPVNHTIAYVHENDVYLSLPSGSTLRLTTTGSTTLFNGVPDWVMEEEIFGSDTTLYWSPDGNRLIWLSFDESKVPEFCIPIYNENPVQAGGAAYTKYDCLKYPKPGFDNPVVSIHLFDSSNTQIANLEQKNVDDHIWQLAFADDDDGDFGDDAIVVDVAWVSPSEVIIKQTNRIQNKFRVGYFNLAEPTIKDKQIIGVTTRVVDYEKIDGGWVEPGQLIYPLPSSSTSPPGYLEILPDKDGYNHIAFFSPVYASHPVFITRGLWEVDGGIHAVDISKGLVYFMAASPASERHVYSANLPNKITFPMLQEGRPPVPALALTASDEAYYSASFSPGAGYFVLNYHGPNIPYQSIVKTGSSDFSKVLEDNEKLYNTTLQFPSPEVVRSEVEIDGIVFETVEMRPPHFDDTGRKKYPVLFEVYGGPASQKTGTIFQRDWHYYLVSTMNYVVVRVDGRGTGFRGRKWRTATRNNLGELEAKDVVDVARLWSQKDYIDSKRVGVWGWSYGGYLTSKIVETNSSVFTLAMAVAPVADWKYYDSVYTERYMSTPTLNPEGYNRSAVVNMEGFKHVDFFLAHGTGDDNVHFLNSAVLLDRLTMADVEGFRFRAFTDSNHSMHLRHAYVALMRNLASFLEEKWGPGIDVKKPEDHPARE